MKTRLLSFDKFVDRAIRLRDRLGQRETRKETPDHWPDGFPSSNALKEVLNAAYFLSLCQYEGCSVHTSFIWEHPGLGQSFIHKLQSPSHDLSLDTLLKYAQAADGKHSAICLTISDGRLAVAGITMCTPDRNSANVSFVPGITITINGPGSILYQEGLLVLHYDKGRRRRLRAINKNTIVRNWLNEVEESIVNRATASLIKNDEQPSFPADIMLTFLCSLLSKIDEDRHGGVLIVLPGDEPTELIDIRFPGTSETFGRLVGGFGVASLIVKRDHPGSVSPMTPAYIDESVNMSRLRNYSRRIANLAKCDGAIVMTRDANFLGFGGIIKAPSVRNTGGQGMESKGARHTSAQWFCENVQGAIAFVVSADGGITIIDGVNVRNSCDYVVW